MLILPEPMLTFKGEDCREFLKKHDNGFDLLPEFLENPTTILLTGIYDIPPTRREDPVWGCLVNPSRLE
jgi:hypothetical protein